MASGWRPLTQAVRFMSTTCANLRLFFFLKRGKFKFGAVAEERHHKHCCLQVHCTIPVYNSCPTAIAINPANSNLVTVHADQRVSDAMSFPSHWDALELTSHWLLTLPVCCVADLWVLAATQRVHGVESTAAEKRTAPPVVGERHARHPRGLQSKKSSSHLDARHVHVLHHWPDSGTQTLFARTLSHHKWCSLLFVCFLVWGN